MLTKEDIEPCLQYLFDSAEDYAKAKADSEQLEFGLKRLKAEKFLQAKGTVAEREAIASSSPELTTIQAGLTEAIRIFRLIEAKRQACLTKIEVWRTIEANNRNFERLTR